MATTMLEARHWREHVAAVFAALGLELDDARIEQTQQASMLNDTDKAILSSVDLIGFRVAALEREMAQGAADIQADLRRAVRNLELDASLSHGERARRVAALEDAARRQLAELMAKKRELVFTQRNSTQKIQDELDALHSLSERAQILASAHDGGPEAQQKVREIQASLRLQLRHLRNAVAPGAVASFLEASGSLQDRVAATLATALAVRVQRARQAQEADPRIPESRDGFRSLAGYIEAQDRARRAQDGRLAHALDLLPGLLA